MKSSFLRAALPLLTTLVAFVALATSCTTQPVLLPSRDFNRPSDVAFLCMGTFDESAAAAGLDAGADGGADDAGPTGNLIASGRPMRVCHPRGQVDVAKPNLQTYAFVPNSESGDITVIDADTWSFVNLDPANASYNRLPVGVLPSQIAASDDGCRLVTANHGSCDLSVVDPAALLAPTLALAKGTAVAGTGRSVMTNVVPRAKNSGRELRLFAGEVQFLPQSTTSLTGAGEDLCSADPSHQWQALATFPSCDLVALIDLPSGIIQKAAYTRATASGVALVPLADGEDPVCPVDCLYPPVDASIASDGASESAPEAATDSSSEAPSDASGDAGVEAAPEGGSSNSEPGDVPFVGAAGTLRPGPIAIVPESGRAYVGMANAAYVLAFNVDQDQLTVPAGGGAIPLHEGALGTNRLRLSIDPYLDKTTSGTGKAGSFIGDDPGASTDMQYLLDRQYLYVIARDSSLRIVQVAHQPETECETNTDFAAIKDPNVQQQTMNAACPAVVGPQVRRPGAIGPGIRLPTPPIDVAVADIHPDPPDPSETSVSGAHAWVLAASGNVYLVNINPSPRNIFWVNTPSGPTMTEMIGMPPVTTTVPAIGQVRACVTPAGDCQPEPAPAPNTLRNRNFFGYTLALDPSAGLPRLDIAPAQASIGPRLESIWTIGSQENYTSLSGDPIQTQVFFPDTSAVTAQTWSVTWEGALMGSPRSSGQLQTSAGNTSLIDLGFDFCRLGVKKNDIATLQGCTQTSQCGIYKVCVLGSNGAEGAGGLPINGLCLSSADLHGQCDDLLSTVKRYDVADAQQSKLALLPHKDELVRPAISPCHPASGGATDGGADGGTDAGDGGAATMTPDTCVDPSDPTTFTFQCLDGRCLDPCDVWGETSGCRVGRICVSFGPRAIPRKPAAGATKPEPCDTKECFCADGPDLDNPDSKANHDICLGELFPYQVGVGRGFLVSGSQTGIPATGVADASGECVPLPNLDDQARIRIPMDDLTVADSAQELRCQNMPDNTLDSRCDPDFLTASCPDATTANQLAAIAQTEGTPNPCQFNGGLNDTDPDGTPDLPGHVHALFRNREVQFMMTNLERPPSGTFQIVFDVHGGFQPQTVVITNYVEVTMPTRLVLGPFDSIPTTGTAGPANEVPYLFVVDQRRLGRTQGGGPAPGQLLRINPRGFAISLPVTGEQPWYEDLAHSANLFPMQ